MSNLLFHQMLYYESIFYFTTNYQSLIQIDKYACHEYIDCLFNEELLSHLLKNKLCINVCKRFASIIEDKSILSYHILAFDEVEWIKLMFSFPDIKINAKDSSHIIVFAACHNLVHEFNILARRLPHTMKVEAVNIFVRACQSGSRDIVKYMIENNHHKEIKSGFEFALIEFSKRNDVDMIKYFDTRGILKEEHMNEIFNSACDHNHPDVIKYMLEEHIKDDKVRNVYATYIINNVSYDVFMKTDFSIFRYILSKYEIMTRREDILCIFQQACETRSIECIEYVLNEYINDDNIKKMCLSPTNNCEMRMICTDVHVVKYLVSRGLDVKANHYALYNIACEDGNITLANHILNDYLHTHDERLQCIQASIKYAIKHCFHSSSEYVIENLNRWSK